MSDEQDRSANENEAAENPAAEASAASAEAEIIAALEAERNELKDRLLRAVAEMDNLRKRTEREMRDTRAYAISNFARDMLTATDNLSRALGTLPAEDRETATDAMKGLIEGVEMTEREMQRLLEKNGVKKIDPKGERFDPHFHQAMFEIPNPEVPEQTVLEVVQSGYVIGERVLRPAMVGVAKGGPKAARPAPAAEPAAEAEAGTGEAGGADPHIDKEV